MKLTILGCGTSAGVPRIGNDWGKCDPTEPKNKRTRVSILVQAEGYGILVDTSPDLRHQLLAAGTTNIDSVLWTHDHADHTHGIDELRQIFFKTRIPVEGYGSAATMTSLKRRFGYVFEGNSGYPTTCNGNILPDKTLQIGPFKVEYTEQPHGPIFSTGYRISHDGKSICYATDFGQITSDMVDLYGRTDLLIVDCLRTDPHPTHANLDMSLQLIDRCAAKYAILTHMDKNMDYRTIANMLPSNVEPAFDMMIVNM